MQAKRPTQGQSNASAVHPHVALFPLGMICATPGALRAMVLHAIDATELLVRHQSGDWGDLCDADRRDNERAVAEGSRILSSYRVGTVKLWIITEYDRSITTILLPEEY
jgi:hypothetical protein